jgi:hypothetical protein
VEVLDVDLVESIFDEKVSQLEVVENESGKDYDGVYVK